MKEKIKEILEIIKENFILLLGVGLFTYSLFNFSSDRYCDTKGGLLPALPFSECTHPATFYYYNDLTLILLVIGAIFIVFGLLKMRKNKGG